MAPAASPAAKPAASPAAKPVASPAASPAAKPAASPAAAKPSAVPTLTAAQQQEVAAFYSGKTIRIGVGSAPGGGYDNTARLVARHISKHIPGNPQAVVDNQPGGGGLRIANAMFNTAPKDGTAIAVFQESQIMNQLTGGEGVQFDYRQFGILGSTFADATVCFVRSETPVRTFQETLTAAEPISFGASAKGATTYDVPALIEAGTGAKFRIVTGYPGSNDIRLAVERGEVNGACLSWETLKLSAAQDIRDGKIRLIVQNALQRHPEIPDVPTAMEFARTEPDRGLLRIAAAPTEISKTFVAPPGIPPLRLQALQAALAAAYRDPELLAEARTARLDLQPKTPEQVREILADLLNTPPAISERYKQILSAD